MWWRIPYTVSPHTTAAAYVLGLKEKTVCMYVCVCDVCVGMWWWIPYTISPHTTTAAAAAAAAAAALLAELLNNTMSLLRPGLAACQGGASSSCI